MLCPKCDLQLPDTCRFCPYCGTTVSVSPAPAPARPAQPVTQAMPASAVVQPVAQAVPQPVPQAMPVQNIPPQPAAVPVQQAAPAAGEQPTIVRSFATHGLTAFNYKFSVKNELGQDLYQAATVTESMTRYTAKLYTLQGHEIFTVKQQSKLTFAAMNFDMLINGRVFTPINQIVHMTSYEFEMPNIGISITGDFLAHNYRFTYNGALVGRLTRKMLAWGDSYVLEFINPQLERPLLAAIMAIELVTIASRNKRRRR